MATVNQQLEIQSASDSWLDKFSKSDFLQLDVSDTAQQNVEQRLRHCFESGQLESFSILQGAYRCEPCWQPQEPQHHLLNLIFLDQDCGKLDRELLRLKSEHELILGACR